MNPAIVAALIELGIKLEPEIEALLIAIFERNPDEEQFAAISLARAAGDKRAAAKFGPLPPSSLA